MPLRVQEAKDLLRDSLPLTDEYLQEVKDLLGRTTPGPWRLCRDGDCSCGLVWSEKQREYLVACIEGQVEDLPPCPVEEHRANRRLMALSRTVIPALIREIERLQRP